MRGVRPRPVRPLRGDLQGAEQTACGGADAHGTAEEHRPDRVERHGGEVSEESCASHRGSSKVADLALSPCFVRNETGVHLIVAVRRR